MDFQFEHKFNTSTVTRTTTICALSATTHTIQNKNRPNIMIIMVDVMGYSDLGCYGGEIKIPNIDFLAHNGVRFTEFSNAARFCPKRASLHTGLYQYKVGLQLNGYSRYKLCNNCRGA